MGDRSGVAERLGFALLVVAVAKKPIFFIFPALFAKNDFLKLTPNRLSIHTVLVEAIIAQ